MNENEQKKIVFSLVQGEEGAAWAGKMYSGWNLTSPEPLCSWKGILCDTRDDSVIAIELENVALRATLPPELGMLSTLEVLVLRQNNIHGTIPSQIVSLPKLEVLDLSRNEITGILPKFKSTYLKDLSLAFNQISGELGTDWPAGHELMVELDISWNKLSGSIPDAIGSMKGLRNLRLSGNGLYGFIPSSMGKLYDIQSLQLDENSLIGRIPKEILSSYSKLSTINLQGNDLSGTLPEALADLRYLAELHINGNKFTGEVPKRLCRTEINIDFYDNAEELPSGMSGANIPPVLRDYCKSIACPIGFVSNEEAWPCQPCPYNSFSPYLGTEGVCMTLDENDILQLVWSMTHGLGWSKVNNWNYDGVRTCSFTGISCDNEGNVISIVLPNFNLQGTIPKELSGLKHLKVLDLSDNMLTGHIPSDLRFPPLEKLDLSGNRLAGLIPPLLCRSEANNNGENGEYHCDNIVCPSGTYGVAGYGECLPCFDNVDTLGRQTCSSSKVQKAEKVSLLILTFIATFSFTLVVYFVTCNSYRKRKLGGGVKIQELSHSDPSVETKSLSLGDPLKNGIDFVTSAEDDVVEWPKNFRRNQIAQSLTEQKLEYGMGSMKREDDNILEWPNNSRRNQRAKKLTEPKLEYRSESVEREDVWLDVPRIS